MVRIKDEPGNQRIADIRLAMSGKVFEEARDLFYEDEGLQDKLIPVFRTGEEEPLMYLRFQSNLSEDFDGEMRKRLPVYVSEFRKYDESDPCIDLSFLKRGEIYVFDEIDEYSYLCAKLIGKYLPEVYVFFTDSSAGLFLEETGHRHIIEGISDFYRNYGHLVSKSIIHVISKSLGMDPDEPEQFLKKKYSSLELMTSLFWQTESESFGTENPDKTFCLIKNPLGMEGLADMLRFAVYRAEAAVMNTPEFIPVIDLSVIGDDNQFNGGNGENVWNMFFRQISAVPPEEVYKSKRVILMRDNLRSLNPWIQEQIFFADDKALFSKWVRFSDATEEYVTNLYADIIPEDSKRILGVIGRGSDYNMNAMEGILNRPSGPWALLSYVEKIFREGCYDRIFLATEDENVFRCFMDSKLKNHISSVPQPRVSISPDDNRFLVDIYKEENRDGYRDNLRYLGIIHILSKCTSLISSTNCGAYRLALGFNGGKYESTEVYDLNAANHQ